MALLTNAFKHNDLAEAVSKLCDDEIHSNYPMVGDYIDPVFGFEPNELEDPVCNYYMDVFMAVSKMNGTAEDRAKNYYEYMVDFVKSRLN